MTLADKCRKVFFKNLPKVNKGKEKRMMDEYNRIKKTIYSSAKSGMVDAYVSVEMERPYVDKLILMLQERDGLQCWIPANFGNGGMYTFHVVFTI